jgi:hypothetical protein
MPKHRTRKTLQATPTQHTQSTYSCFPSTIPARAKANLRRKGQTKSQIASVILNPMGWRQDRLTLDNTKGIQILHYRVMNDGSKVASWKYVPTKRGDGHFCTEQPPCFCQVEARGANILYPEYWLNPARQYTQTFAESNVTCQQYSADQDPLCYQFASGEGSVNMQVGTQAC